MEYMDKVEFRRHWVQNHSPHKCPKCSKPTVAPGQYCSVECAIVTPEPKIDDNEALRNENKRLREVLEFYASEKTYQLDVNITMGSAHPMHEPIKYDKGDRAREVLGLRPKAADSTESA